MYCNAERPAVHGVSVAAAALALASPLALASDFSGIVTVLFGVPALLALDVILGLMLVAEPSPRTRQWAGILGLPTLFVGFLLWADAVSLFRMESSLPWGVLYFLLYAVGVALLWRHFARRATPAEREGGAGN